MKDAQRRAVLIQKLGADIARFQDASYALDEAAARAVGVDRIELRAIGMLLFGGAMPLPALRGALELTPRAFATLIMRLELAGYARRVPGAAAELVELTAHARKWVETIWGPMQREGVTHLSQHTTPELELLARHAVAMCAIQETHAARVRALSEVSAFAKSRRARGGLSPAALRRVQLYVEANLQSTVSLQQMASAAGLSEFHFARAFKNSLGISPRQFVEQRRVHKAKAFLRESSLRLAQVAAEVGLGSQSRFTTVFRRATGLTPATYRRGSQSLVPQR